MSSEAAVAGLLAEGFECFSRKEYTRMRQLFERAASHDHVDALLHLGSLYLDGVGVEQDFPLARYYFEKIVLQHTTSPSKGRALMHLAWLHQGGLGCDENPALARALYDEALEYFGCELVPASVLNQLLHKPAALLTSPQAITATSSVAPALRSTACHTLASLAHLCSQGKGGAVDLARAGRCLATAAVLGDTDAMVGLGMLLQPSMDESGEESSSSPNGESESASESEATTPTGAAPPRPPHPDGTSTPPCPDRRSHGTRARRSVGVLSDESDEEEHVTKRLQYFKGLSDDQSVGVGAGVGVGVGVGVGAGVSVDVGVGKSSSSRSYARDFAAPARPASPVEPLPLPGESNQLEHAASRAAEDFGQPRRDSGTSVASLGQHVHGAAASPQWHGASGSASITLMAGPLSPGAAVAHEVSHDDEGHESHAEGGTSDEASPLGKQASSKHRPSQGLNKDCQSDVHLHPHENPHSQSHSHPHPHPHSHPHQSLHKDAQLARMWLEEAAARGNSHAYVNLGWLHQIGCGAPVDYAKAREYYESTLQSDADDPAAVACALRNLGCMYEHGLGVTVSHTQARELYERASQGGDAVACVLLGLMEEESDNAHRSTISRAVHALGRSLIALADSESLLLSTHNLHNTHHQSHDAHNSADAAASQALPHRPPPSLYAHQSTLPSTGCAARFYKQAQALSGSGSGGEDLCQYGVWVLRGRGGIPASPLRAQRFFEIALLLDPASRAGHYLTVTHQLQAKKCVSTLSHTLASLLGHSNAACSAKRSAGSLSSPQCTWHSDPDCICSTLVDATSLGCVCACGAVALALMAVQRRTHE